MNGRIIVAAIVALTVVIGCFVGFNGAIGWCDAHEWQVHQSLSGKMTVIDAPGPYWRGFGKVWEYPLTLEAEYSDDEEGSIEATFNDGGKAKISSFVKVQMPTKDESRLRLHKEFNANPHNVVVSVRTHLTNCIKSAGPVMSATENQAARKSEFNQIIEEQLSRGLFKMKRIAVELEGISEIVEKDGKQITQKAKVMATQIEHDATGKPIVIQPSPLLTYDLHVLQFSVTETEYDQATQTQFAAKKESYLKAEQAKALQQEEVQQRLMLEEKGRRQVAEVQAEENQKKERAEIQAEQAAQVAVINKRKAVTEAQQKAEVAEQERMEAEKRKEIAAVTAETAELHKRATISAAEAQQKAIALGGGISEEKRVLAQIDANRDIAVAEALSKVAVPGIVIVGGEGGTGEGAGLQGTLMNLVLLKETGVIRQKNYTPVTAGPDEVKIEGVPPIGGKN